MINEITPNRIQTRPTEEFDFEKILDIVFREGWIVATISLLVLIGSIYHFYKLPNTYTASSKLVIVNLDEESVVEKQEVENIKPNQRRLSYGQDKSQLIIMTGSEMLEELSRYLNLKERLNAASHKQAAKIVQSRIRADYEKGSDVISINVTWENPVLCRDIANGLAEVYAKDYIKQRLYLSKEVLKWFPDEAEYLSNETIYGQIKAMSDKDIISSLPSVAKDRVIEHLKKRKSEIEQDLLKFSKLYKDKHPTMINLKSDLAYTEGQIDRETSAIVRGIKGQLSGFLQINAVRIIAYADTPTVPVGPNRGRGILMATLLSFFLSMSAIVVFETLNTKIKNEFDLKENTGIPFLGYVPRIGAISKSNIGTEIFSNIFDKEILDAFAYIRTSVSFAAPKERSNTFLVSSSIPSEGKSLLSVQLAQAFAKNNEKTILIDADLRQPCLHHAVGKKREPGLTDYLVKDLKEDDVIQNVQGWENLFFIASGHITPNPSELIGSDRFRKLIVSMRSKFDRIIVDSAPLLDMPDSFLLSKLVDGVIVVVKSGEMDRRVLVRTLEKLQQANANITGAVINNYLPQRYGPYYYRYYRKRYYNYCKKSDEKTSMDT